MQRVTMAAAAAVLVAVLVAAAVAAPANHMRAGRRLIALSETERVWMTEAEVLQLRRQKDETGRLGLGFIDVTDHPVPAKATFRRAFPTGPAQQAVVLPLASRMSADVLTSFLTPFTTFNNRYYTSATGVEAMEWLRDYMEAIATAAGRNDTSCILYGHNFAQSSVVCRIQGRGANADEVVIVSAHADSINSLSPASGRAPGADDDGSGVAGFVEAFRAIVNGGFYPSRSIEFIGYAAEEVGLRGSDAIAEDYVSRGVKVYAVYQNEMSAYPGNQRTLSVLTDYTDPALVTLTQALVPVYTNLQFIRETCGYGCSDHASWNERDVPAMCTAEAGPNSNDLNPQIHRAGDDMNLVDASFTLEFAKLALGMIIELSEFSG